MGYAYRFMFPVAPLFFTVSSIRLQLLIGLIENKFIQKAILLIPIILLTGYFPTLKNYKQYANNLENAHIKLGEMLSIYPEKSRKLAVNDAGAIPYFSGWYTVDIFGLNNEYIAFNKNDRVNFVLKMKPDLIILRSNLHDIFKSHLIWEQELYSKIIKSGYKNITVIKFADGYFLWLFCKENDLDLINFIKKYVEL